VILPVTTNIAKLAGELSRSKQCKNVNAVLAATALEENAHLATLNRRDFSSVKKLKLFD
jgi:predicted nucleic acid-binding protein